MFIGRKELHLSEDDIWDYTPKKFFALLECAIEYNKLKSGSKDKEKTKKTKVTVGFIDQISGW